MRHGEHERRGPAKRLSRDPGFVAELAYCVPAGIPHSVFLDWLEEDQAKALAFQRFESARCPQCGTFPNAWLDDAGRLLPDPPFEAELVACYGCRAVAEVQDRAQQEAPDDSGLRARLVVAKRDVTEPNVD